MTAVEGSPSLAGAELEAAEVSCCTGGCMRLAAEMGAAEVGADEQCFNKSSRQLYACLLYLRGTDAALAHFALGSS